MNESHDSHSSRRQFLKDTGGLAAASALAGVALPAVHAAENDAIQIALIGCGGRGTGAAADALSVKQGPVKLVAMADVFEDRLKTSFQSLSRQFDSRVDLPEDRKFLGFDAYQKAMDCLEPGDIAIFTTPLAFRWVHFGYAIQKGLNVFMEKPLTADGPTELDFTRENVLAGAEERVLDEPMLKIDGKDVANTVEQVLQTVLGDHYLREWSDYSKSELLILVHEYAMHGTPPIDKMGVYELLTEIMEVCGETYEFETMDDFVRNLCWED